MNRRQFGLRVLGLVGGLMAALKVQSVQAGNTFTLKNVGKTPVAFTTGPDTPLLREMRENFNRLMRGVSSVHVPHTIFMGSTVYLQFIEEMEALQASYPPHMRFVFSDGVHRFKGAKVHHVQTIPALQYMMLQKTSPYTATFTYRG